MTGTDKNKDAPNAAAGGSADFAALADRWWRIMARLMQHRAGSSDIQIPDPGVVMGAFARLFRTMMADPARIAAAQDAFWRDSLGLWAATAKRLAGEEAEAVVQPQPGDKRFKDSAWIEDAVFDFIKQSYLLASEFMRSSVSDADGLDAKTREKVAFYTRQVIDAMAPTNFVATNPKVLRTTVESRGENLIRGLDHLLGDLERGRGRLRISMVDEDAFTLAETIAVTPGQVVFQNDLMQLLQYAPSTRTVAKRPLLIVPPWINKYYVLDLRPGNSLIKWLVDGGLTVFVVSWVNPDERLSHKTFEDYMLEGPLAAMDAIAAATGEEGVDAVGYCIGGTLLACTLAYLAATDERRIASATLLTTLVDFAQPGELSVFIDDEQLALLDAHMEERGYLEGRHMAQVFNLVRDNDLIWSFVVNNYLMGREPPAFDLLYWNSDSTRMPAMMHGFYLRKMYLENRLVEPGGIALGGVAIDLGAIRVPTYVLSTMEDHIAPWKATYPATRLFGGPTTFVLSASGHIAGVVNPPDASKYCYWTNRRKRRDADAWLESATRHEGSWWPHWRRWLRRPAGASDRVPARIPGEGGLDVIEDAPGSYVRVRYAD